MRTIQCFFWSMLGLSVLISAGCGDSNDDDKGDTTVRLGGLGESCQRAADCQPELACVGQICTDTSSSLSATGKVCKLVECAVREDCCNIVDSAEQCQTWKDACATNPAACESYTRFCTCERWACNAGRCDRTDPCTGVGSVCPGRQVCNGTTCVDCVNDLNCQANEKCSDARCVLKCKSDGDCGYLSSCVDSVCVASGCTTDRECIATTGNIRAVCREKKCTVPCTSYVECRTDAPGSEFQGCVDGVCVDLGCETDQECRIRLDTNSSTPRKHAVCAANAP